MRLLDTFGDCWITLETAGDLWRLLATFGDLWRLLDTFELETAGVHSRAIRLSAVSEGIQQSPKVSSSLRRYPAVSEGSQQSPKVSSEGILDTFGDCWIPLETAGYFGDCWIPLETAGYFGDCWIPLETAGYLWRLLATFEDCWIPSETAGYLRIGDCWSSLEGHPAVSEGIQQSPKVSNSLQRYPGYLRKIPLETAGYLLRLSFGDCWIPLETTWVAVKKYIINAYLAIAINT